MVKGKATPVIDSGDVGSIPTGCIFLKKVESLGIEPTSPGEFKINSQMHYH